MLENKQGIYKTTAITSLHSIQVYISYALIAIIATCNMLMQNLPQICNCSASNMQVSTGFGNWYAALKFMDVFWYTYIYIYLYVHI